MPWTIVSDNPDCSGFAVVKDDDGSVAGCHKNEADAKAQLAALYASEEDAMSDTPRTDHPRDDLYRAMAGGVTSDDGRTLTIRLAPHDQFAEIQSKTEGHFMERFGRTAYKKSMADNPPKILFQHGKDPQIGEKPIATTDEVGSDSTSPYARGRILDGLPELVADGLRKNVYGASHRFSVVRESWVENPPAMPHNPTRLPERTITEAQLHELGPVTWPAYASASASLRSLTDEYRGIPIEPEAPSLDAEAETPHLEPERRDEPVTVAAPQPEEIRTVDTDFVDISMYITRDEKVARLTELEREMETLDKQFEAVKMPDEPQARWDAFKAEKAALLEAVEAADARKADMGRHWSERTGTDPERGYSPPVVSVIKQRDLVSIYDVQRTMRESRSTEQFASTLHDNAMRAVEGAAFQATERTKGQGEVEQLIKGGGPLDQIDTTEVAKRVLYTGSPAYRRAYRKWLIAGRSGNPMFTPEEGAAFHESRASLVTASNTAVPFDLDPTMIINTSGAINPYRQAFRVVKTTSNDWRPSVTSGMTAVYEDEATAATDLAPTFTAPARLLVKAHTLAKYSVEIQQDYALGSLEAELAREIADAKDVLEATEFGTGNGSTHHPNGIFNYYTSNFLDTTTTLVVVPKDLYALAANIGPRYRGNLTWLGSPYFYSLVRGIDTAGGAGLWVDNLSLGGSLGAMENNGRLGNLIGYPAFECIAPANTSMATTEKVAILANRERFVIIDRIGLNLQQMPFVSASTGLPNGEEMVYAWWRNTSVGLGLATLGAGREACIFRGK
jgi:HK97 family phage major capsid protein